MRVNSPGPDEADDEDGAPGCGADEAGGCAEGALIELNIRVKAPGSEERSEAGCDAPAGKLADGAGGLPAGSGWAFFCMGTWLNICETSCAGLDAAVVGAFCSIEVSVCSMRVNSPGPDFAAEGRGGAGVAGGGAAEVSIGFSAAAAGALPCVRSKASRSSSAAIGFAETCPKIPVALAGSPAGEASAPRPSGFSFGFLEDSIRGHPGF